jgi:hypothetical protein
LTSKEDPMFRLLLALSPANLLHEFGTGRARDNACRERDELARTMAAVDALAGRLEPTLAAVPAVATAEERVAA